MKKHQELVDLVDLVDIFKSAQEMSFDQIFLLNAAAVLREVRV